MSRKSAISSLTSKLTTAQMVRRGIRISGRQTVAERLTQVLAMHHALLNRAFVGRFKWLLFGR